MQVLLPSHEAPSPHRSPRRGEGDELSFSPSSEGRTGFFPLAPIGEREPEGRVRGRVLRATEPQHRSFPPDLNQAQLSTGPASPSQRSHLCSVSVSYDPEFARGHHE
jgi:hypothetical protein